MTTIRSLAAFTADVTSALARPVLHTGWGYGSGVVARRLVLPLLLLELLADEDDPSPRHVITATTTT